LGYPEESGAFSIKPKILELSKHGKWYGNFLVTVLENLRIMELRIPKCEPFNRRFLKFREENKMEL
jgi:hypothetical protein